MHSRALILTLAAPFLAGALAATPAAGADAGASAGSLNHSTSRTVVLVGTVKTVDWDPASLRFTIAVTDTGGSPPVWTVQGPALATLQRFGWSTRSLAAGQSVAAVVHPAPGGQRSGTLVRVITESRRLEAGESSVPTMPAAGIAPLHLPAGAADPVAGYYGNTMVCSGPAFECHVWFYRDGHFIMFSRDQAPDGSWAEHGREGTFWLQKLGDVDFMCMQETTRPFPLCHHRVNFEKPGTPAWTIIQPSGAHEKNWIVPGHQ